MVIDDCKQDSRGRICGHFLSDARPRIQCDSFQSERCYIDSARLQLVGRMQSPGGYTRTGDGFKIKQLDFAQWQAAQAAQSVRS